MTTHATYVYCILRSARAPSSARMPAGVPGAGGAAVLAAADGLWMVAAEVPLDVYGPVPLERALRDLDWVGAVALRHEAVVEHFARRRAIAVVPMKLFTMFSTRERAAAAIRGRRRALERVFRRIAGCEEWGVRVTRQAAVPPGETRKRPAGRPSGGAAFLAARKRARDEAVNARRAAADAAEEAYRSLAGLACDRRRRDAGGPGPSPLLDAAFLVRADERATFRAAARRLARQVAHHGGIMTLTGPWPPYNFVMTGGRD